MPETCHAGRAVPADAVCWGSFGSDVGGGGKRWEVRFLFANSFPHILLLPALSGRISLLISLIQQKSLLSLMFAAALKVLRFL